MTTEIAVIVACFLIGAWLSAALKALRDLSWGGIGRLDSQKQKDLIERAEGWMDARDELVTLSRLLALLNLAFVITAAGRMLSGQWPVLAQDWAKLGLAVLAAAAVFVLVTEGIGSLLAVYAWPVLTVSIPLLKMLRIVPGLAVYPALLMEHKLERLMNSDEEEEKPTTEDEIEALLEHGDHVNEDEESNGIEKSTGRMIRGILDLDETLVKEIMTPRVDIDAVSETATIEEIKHRIIESGHSRIPVYRDHIDDIVGIIYSKNLLDDQNTGKKPLADIMHRATYIPETKNVDDLLQEFKQQKVHIAVVIDEYGGTAGLVSLEDILEEIVGEIADEFDEDDEEEKPLQLATDGSLKLEARTPIDDVNDAMDLDLPEEEDHVTIGGYITSQLGRIPKAGEQVTLEDVEIEILAADDRKLSELIIRKTSAAAPASRDH